MRENPLVWVEIYVDDMPRARAFYEAVFGCSLTRLESVADLEMWGFPMARGHAGAGGALVKIAGLKAGANSTIAYFGCDDCAVEEAKAAKAGGRIHKKKFPIGQYGFISLVVDSEGNMIGLHSVK